MSAALALRDTLPCPPPDVSKYDVIDAARTLARESDITELGALAILADRGDLPVESVYGALVFLERVAALSYLVELVRGADDPTLALVCGGVCNCQSCARKYLLDPVTCEVDYDMLLESTRVGFHESWKCDCCDRSFTLPSERDRAWQ